MQRLHQSEAMHRLLSLKRAQPNPVGQGDVSSALRRDAHSLRGPFWWKWAAGVALAFALTHGSSARAADANEQAREHYQRGVLLYQQGAYKDSLSELTEARKLTRSYTILLNIGQVRAKMGDFLGAIEAYRQYLGEGGARLSAGERQDAEKEIVEFESRLATPTVESDVPFAEVVVDAVRVGQTPLTLRLNPGEHELRVAHKDHPAADRRVSLAQGTHERLSFNLASPPQPVPNAPVSNQSSATGVVAPGETSPARSPSASSPSEPRTASDSEIRDTGRLIAWSAAGTLAAGAAVTGIWALFSNHSLAELRDAPEPRDHSAMESQATKTRVLATFADGFLLGAVGLGAWLTLDPHAFSSKKTSSSRALKVHAGLGNVSLSAQF